MSAAGPAPMSAIVGVGIDAVDVDRFRRVLARRPGLVDRVFTEAEQREAGTGGDRAERLAARFAAKEATMKALGTGLGGFALRDVEVRRAPGRGAGRGRPSLALASAATALAGRRGVDRWHVSLTHTASVAMAVVVAEGRPLPAEPG